MKATEIIIGFLGIGAALYLWSVLYKMILPFVRRIRKNHPAAAPLISREQYAIMEGFVSLEERDFSALGEDEVVKKSSFVARQDHITFKNHHREWAMKYPNAKFVAIYRGKLIGHEKSREALNELICDHPDHSGVTVKELKKKFLGDVQLGDSLLVIEGISKNK